MEVVDRGVSQHPRRGSTHSEDGRPKTPWQSFSSHVSNVTTDGGYNFNPVKLKLKSSVPFSTVMGDYVEKRRQQIEREKERERERERLAEEARKRGIQIEEEPEEEAEVEDIFEEDEDETVSQNTPLKMAALRGWARLRRNVQERAMKNKSKKSGFNWAFLNAHLKNMSSKEQARLNLYEKYITKPDTWSEGLSEKHIQFLKNIAAKKRGGGYPPKTRSFSDTSSYRSRGNVTSRSQVNSPVKASQKTDKSRGARSKSSSTVT